MNLKNFKIFTKETFVLLFTFLLVVATGILILYAAGIDVRVIVSRPSPTYPVADHFVLSGIPEFIYQNESQSLKVTVKDKNETLVFNYNGTVHLTSSDPNALLPADHKFSPEEDGGIYTFSPIIFKTPGKHWIKAEDIENPSISGLLNTTVLQKIGYFTIENYPQETKAGVPFSQGIKVSVYDENGNLFENYQGSVYFTSSDPLAELYFSEENKYRFTSEDKGVHVFEGENFILKTEGYQTITVTDGLSFATTDKILVKEAPYSIEITAPSEVTAGEEFDLLVEIKDKNGNLISDYEGTIELSSSDPKSEIPESYKFTLEDKGKKTFKIRLKTKGLQEIKIVEKETNLTVSSQIKVNPGPTSLTKSTIEIHPSKVKADGKEFARITVTLVDEFENPIENHEVEVFSNQTGDLFEPINPFTDSEGKASFLIRSTSAHLSKISAKDRTLNVFLSKTAVVAFFIEFKEEKEKKIPFIFPTITPLPPPLLAPDPQDFTEENKTLNPSPNFLGTTISNAEVSLYLNDQFIGKIKSDKAGKFSFRIPKKLTPGSYQIYAIVKDSLGRTSPKSAIISFEIIEKIKPELPPIGGIQKIKKSTSEIIVNLRTNPTLRKVAKIGIPTAAGVVVLTGISFLLQILASLADLLALLSYLFSWLLELIGIKKRAEKWGIVYNAASKVPIDLAIVRVLKAKKLIRTKVTDKLGRFGFLLGKGKYTLLVTKPGFLFPSKQLKGLKIDGKYKNLYFGGLISIRSEKESAKINVNIPLDPKEKAKIKFIDKLRTFVTNLFWPVWILGFLTNIFSSFIYPSVVNGLIFLFYILILLLRKILLGTSPRPWGRVLDKKTKKPIANATVRIIDAREKKILETKITDKYGRFNFILPKGKYYLKVIAPGYKPFKGKVFELKTGEMFKGDVLL